MVAGSLAVCLSLVGAAQGAPKGAGAAQGENCTLTGTAGADLLRGTPRRDVICGRGGEDSVLGLGGNDQLIGGGGPDLLLGGPGDDLLSGGAGRDRLYGGLGADRCPAPRRMRVGPSADLVQSCDRGGGKSVPAAGGFVVVTPVRADRVPPELTSISVEPSSLDVLDGDGLVTIRLGARDAGPVASVRMKIADPGEEVWREIELGGGGAEYSATTQVAVPSTSELGSYYVSELRLEDSAGNVGTLGAAQLDEWSQARFEVFEGPDEVAPQLEGFSVTPSSFDTQAETVPVRLDVDASDSLSGVESVWVQLVPPTWDGEGEGRYVELRDLTAGDSLKGSWETTFEFPRHSSPGAYAVNKVLVRDWAGNQREYLGAELQALGLPTGLTQTGPGDATPPEIADLTIVTPTISTANGDDLLLVDVQVKDALSGAGVLDQAFAQMYIDIEGVNVPNSGYGGGSPTLVSGDPFDGVWRHELNLPYGAEPGEYRVSQVDAVDLAGNRTLLEDAALEAKGWDLTFVNQP